MAASMGPGAPPATAGVPAAAMSTVSTDVDTPEEITEALARLADLRDKGVLSPEEYEAKKQELLNRL
jgi:hypothetical protein